MILVDTSIWIEHFRRGDRRLQDLLHDEQVLVHPFVIGELACGNLRNRDEILDLLSALPGPTVASQDEVLRLIEAERLSGKRLGWVDMHLLASARLSGCRIWTRDKALAGAASRMNLGA